MLSLVQVKGMLPDINTLIGNFKWNENIITGFNNYSIDKFRDKKNYPNRLKELIQMKLFFDTLGVQEQNLIAEQSLITEQINSCNLTASNFSSAIINLNSSFSSTVQPHLTEIRKHTNTSDYVATSDYRCLDDITSSISGSFIHSEYDSTKPLVAYYTYPTTIENGVSIISKSEEKTPVSGNFKTLYETRYNEIDSTEKEELNTISGSITYHNGFCSWTDAFISSSFPANKNKTSLVSPMEETITVLNKSKKKVDKDLADLQTFVIADESKSFTNEVYQERLEEMIRLYTTGKLL